MFKSHKIPVGTRFLKYTKIKQNHVVQFCSNYIQICLFRVGQIAYLYIFGLSRELTYFCLMKSADLLRNLQILMKYVH